MTTFKDIEKKYLEFNPLDKKLIPFYEKNKHYFTEELPTNEDEWRKYLWMLEEIGATYSKEQKYKLALPILERVINLYQQHCDELSINLEEEREYNDAIFWKALALFNTGRIFQARPLLKEIAQSSSDNKEYQKLSAICELKIRKRIVNFVGIFGLLLIVIEYSIKGFSSHRPFWGNIMGITGGLLLMFSGIYSLWSTIRPKN